LTGCKADTIKIAQAEAEKLRAAGAEILRLTSLLDEARAEKRALMREVQTQSRLIEDMTVAASTDKPGC
jgi:hypothetical protein